MLCSEGERELDRGRVEEAEVERVKRKGKGRGGRGRREGDKGTKKNRVGWGKGQNWEAKGDMEMRGERVYKRKRGRRSWGENANLKEEKEITEAEL